MRNFAMAGLIVVGLAQVGTPLRADQSLVEIANKEKARREAITAPAKVYTNEDLRQVPGSPNLQIPTAPAPPSASNVSALPDPRYSFPPIPVECSRTERSTEPSQATRETFNCPDGTTHVKWTNERDGITWRQAYRTDGSQYGVNSCGVRWVLYVAPQRTYLNSRGERREGVFAERAIVDGDLACASEQRAQLPALVQQPPPKTEVIILERPLYGYPYAVQPPPVEPPPPPKPPPAAVPGGTIIPCQTPPSGDPKRDAQVAALCR